MRVAIVLLVLALASCCPFPWPRVTLIRPGGTVRVLDAQKGEPLEDATVIVRRYRLGPPPRIETHTFEERTDASGEASFEIELGKETVMPLFMHGVPQWAFEVCVVHEGHVSASRDWLVVSPQADRKKVGQIEETLVFELEAGESSGCPWEEREEGE